MNLENIRLCDIFDFLELKVYDGKTFVYGANKFSKNSNPTIKKKYNYELNDATKIRDDMNDFIKKRFSFLDLQKIFKYKQKGIESIYNDRSLLLGMELINSYNASDIEQGLNEEIIIEKKNLISIMLAGNSGAGKSTLIKCFVPKEYRSLINPIIGMRETSIFKSYYYIINQYVRKKILYLIDKNFESDEKFIVLKPQFKSSKQIKEMIHQNFFNFIKKQNIYILENINSDIISESNKINKLWKKSIKHSIESFLIDDGKIFNLQLILGKFDDELLNDDSSLYKELFDLLEKYILMLEECILSNVSKIIDISNKETFLIINKVQYMLNKKNILQENNEASDSKELILEQIDCLYNSIIESNKEELEKNIYNFLFDKFIKIFAENFSVTINKERLSNKLEYYDEIKISNETYTSYQLPVGNPTDDIDKDMRKRMKDKNCQLISEISKILKSFYANNKSVTLGKSYIAPLLEKVDVYLPQNESINSFNNEKIYCFIDTVGLDHGKNVDKKNVAKRLQSYLNENEPDFVLLNINFKEKIDLLEEAVNYIDTIGMLNRTLILPSYIDELFKYRIETEYLESYISSDEFEELINEKKLILSNKSKHRFDEKFIMGLFNLEDIEKEDKIKIIDILMKKYFKEVYEYVTEVLINNEIKKSFSIIDQNKLLKKIVYIDRVDELTVFDKGCNLKPEIAIDKTINTVHEVCLIPNKIAKFNIDINYNEYIVLLEKLLKRYQDEQKKLYEECNIHWATLDVGIRELKNNGVGQKWGNGYNITPAEDFQYDLIELLNHIENKNKIIEKVFEFKMAAIDSEELKNTKDEFYRLFNKHIGKVLHYYFVTNNMNVYEILYKVRYGKDRMYYDISMTKERKLRLKEFLLNISQNIEKINVLIRVALEDAKKELIDLTESE